MWGFVVVHVVWAHRTLERQSVIGIHCNVEYREDKYQVWNFVECPSDAVLQKPGVPENGQFQNNRTQFLMQSPKGKRTVTDVI